MKKRILAGVLCASLIASMSLAGCGNSSSETSSSAASSTSSASETSSASSTIPWERVQECLYRYNPDVTYEDFRTLLQDYADMVYEQLG